MHKSEKRTMETIPEILRARMESIFVIVEKASRYLEIVREIVQSINSAEYKKVNDDLATMRSFAEEIPTMDITQVHLLRNMTNLYQKFVTIEQCFASVVSLFENQTYTKLAVYNMSSTYTTNIYHERNAAILAHEKYLDTATRDDEIIFKIVFDKITDINEAVAFVIDNENIINKFTIKLIHWVISNTSGEKRRRVELIVEKQKDILLNATRMDMRNQPGVQGLIYRYNLRPLTPSIPINELFDQLGAKYNAKISPNENFESFVRKGPGLIVINKATSSPVEFSLSGLIDIDYVTAHDLKTNPLSGLTKKIVERFNTARLLPRGGVSEPVKHFVGKTQNWYVIESINGELWRILGLRGEKIIPNDAIIGIIKGLTTRPHQYNVMQCETILKKCLDPKAKVLLMDYEEEKIAAPSSEPIRFAIIDTLTRGFETRLAKINNPNSFRELAIDRDNINETLLDILTHSTGIYGKGSSEYLITYIAKFDGIIRAFTKELERRWGEEVLPERLFKEHSGEDLKNMLRTIFISVVTASVDELDRSRTWTEYDMTLKEFFLERKQAIV